MIYANIIWLFKLLTVAVLLSMAVITKLWQPEAYALESETFELKDEDIKLQANAVLALMAYSVVPNITTSSLSISNNATGDPGFAMTQLAGGFTFSRSVPLYLEGGIAYSQYDPTFIADEGRDERLLPVEWDSLMLSGGVGWDFPLTTKLSIRPIFNFSLGHVSSDLSFLNDILDRRTNSQSYKEADKEIDFLDNGRLNVIGYGGSVMFDYEDYAPERDIDVEWRFTDVVLKSYGSTSEIVTGKADAISTNLWARWRAPSGYKLLHRPLRYVLEGAHTTFFGDQAGALGFNHLTSVGLGLELDSSAYDIYISRTRLVGRYVFGKNITGFSIGLAVSF